MNDIGNDIGMACGLADALRKEYERANVKTASSKAKFSDLMKMTANEWVRWFSQGKNQNRKGGD